jgi:hypothetical protein
MNDFGGHFRVLRERSLTIISVKMVGRCAVPGCKSTYFKGNKKENEVTLFAIPKTSLSKWRELITCSNLTSTSHICSRHFNESDYQTGIEILNVFHPFKRRILNAGAMPWKPIFSVKW